MTLRDSFTGHICEMPIENVDWTCSVCGFGKKQLFNVVVSSLEINHVVTALFEYLLVGTGRVEMLNDETRRKLFALADHLGEIEESKIDDASAISLEVRSSNDYTETSERG